MKRLHLLIAAACSLSLMACASGPNVAAQRKSHFNRAPQLHADLDAMLAQREPAVCEAGEAKPETLGQPLVRIPPNMPQGSVTSGTCSVTFDVNTSGELTNIRSSECTDEIYAYSTRKSASKWKYAPAILNGNAIATCNVESRLTFQLRDERGKMLPIYKVDKKGSIVKN